jgi:hypothetical protein
MDTAVVLASGNEMKQTYNQSETSPVFIFSRKLSPFLCRISRKIRMVCVGLISFPSMLRASVFKRGARSA